MNSKYTTIFFFTLKSHVFCLIFTLALSFTLITLNNVYPITSSPLLLFHTPSSSTPVCPVYPILTPLSFTLITLNNADPVTSPPFLLSQSLSNSTPVSLFPLTLYSSGSLHTHPSSAFPCNTHRSSPSLAVCSPLPELL